MCSAPDAEPRLAVTLPYPGLRIKCGAQTSHRHPEKKRLSYTIPAMIVPYLFFLILEYSAPIFT